MALNLMSLPSELVALVLSRLSISSLLSFSATSRKSQEFARQILRNLDLAIFPREIHSRLAIASQHWRDNTTRNDYDEPRFSVRKTTSVRSISSKKGQNPVLLRRQQILAQNAVATNILNNKSVQNLQSLALYMYDIESAELTTAIARNLPNLQHLELNFCHPYIHDAGISTNHWREAPAGNPCWNALAGLGAQNQKLLRLRNLLSLRIERAGLTCSQLRMLVESNPNLRSLQLINVTGVDLEFVNWLAQHCENESSKIRTLQLEGCLKLNMHSVNDLDCLARMARSKISFLSLRRCPNIRQQALDEFLEEGGTRAIEIVVMPQGQVVCFGQLEQAVPSTSTPLSKQTGTEILEKPVWHLDKIDVDPEYMTTFAVAA